ncbi:MAG: 1-deoxy-D-xylulose-5-phosphate reductoisomerase [Bacteroidales bacterium]|jgi:1-deoxy-D-xylulose-5-phosphate reductoisomerase
MRKRIAILGSTGSIGTQSLQVISGYPDFFELTVITAHDNDDLLIKQALEFEPKHVVISNPEKYESVKKALALKFPEVHAGEKMLEEIVRIEEIDIVITALVGFAGLFPTISAIRSGKDIALANKETLVVAGELITSLAKKNRSALYPVDSEHSAIFQCLAGESYESIEKIYLTASGGPFRGMTAKQLKKVTVDQALNHPNWCMGDKVTIDSASLMNKGLEAIEAKWLFALEPEQINVIVHPQSVIHSIVQFTDGSMKAQMGLPDMRLPIQYALGYPVRLSNNLPRFSFLDYPELHFEKPDVGLFKNLNIAFGAMRTGGNIPCAMNAANEIAVQAFLHDNLPFVRIPELIEKTISKIDCISHPSLEEYKETNTLARKLASQLIIE